MTRPVEEHDITRAGREPLTAAEVDQLAASRDLIGLGALADERRRQMHGDRVTFVRVQEIRATQSVATLDVLPGAGELRILAEPPTRREAVSLVERVVAAAGSVPVTGYALHQLATLCQDDAGTLEGFLEELKCAGLAMVAEARVDLPGVRDCLEASREAGIDVARLGASEPMANGGIDLALQIRGWGASVSHVHALDPLPRGADPRRTTGYGDARRVALARLLVDNIDSIQVDWSRYGPKLAQVALTFGADDVDAVSPVDVSEQGPRRSPLEEIRRNIEVASLVPVQRNGRFDTRDV